MPDPGLRWYDDPTCDLCGEEHQRPTGYLCARCKDDLKMCARVLADVIDQQIVENLTKSWSLNDA